MIIIPEEIKALIFDLDGTLADTMPIHLESWERAGKELQVEITRELIIKHAGTPTVDLVHHFNKEFGWNLEPSVVRATKQKYFDQIKNDQGKIKPVENIFVIAENMRGKMPMSVGTGSSRGNALQSLKDLGAEDWWATVICGSDDIAGKPAPDIFLACAKSMGVSPEYCLVFEDGKAGIEAAKAAGMPFIDVNEHLK